MTKTKKKSTRSVNSGTSKSSSKTAQASNVVYASTKPSKFGKEGKPPKSSSSKKKKKPMPTNAVVVPVVPEPPRTPEQNPHRQRLDSNETQPVDLDNMVDTINRSNEMGISPAETYDTISLSAESRSYDSGNSRPKKKNGIKQLRSHGDNNRSADYLPATLLNFDSPDKKKKKGSKGSSNDKVVIELKNNNPRSACGGASSFVCMLKPLFFLLFLVAGAAIIYGWIFRFPSLNRQVEALEEQVNILQNENDRYERLNNRLNITVDDLEDVRDDLNGTVSELDQVASSLNTTNYQLVAEIEELQNQNSEYSRINKGLQANVAELATEVDLFQEALEELSNEHSILKTTTSQLQDLAATFTNTTIDQNQTLTVLKETLEAFQVENDRLEDFNKKLEIGLNYLNETLFANGNLVESSAVTLGEITEVLGEQVQQQQRSSRFQLEISYRQVMAGWDCDYPVIFRTEPYGQDYDSVMPSNGGNLLPSDVQTYINERVLSKMCLDPNDFNNYLSSTVSSNGVTSNQLMRAVVLYTDDAMKYYFPADEDDANGVTLDQWIDASFRCGLLDNPFGRSRKLKLVESYLRRRHLH